MITIPVTGNYTHLIETCFCGAYNANLCENDDMMLVRLNEEHEACSNYEEADYSIRIVDLHTGEIIYTFRKQISGNTEVTEIYQSDTFKAIKAFYN